MASRPLKVTTSRTIGFSATVNVSATPPGTEVCSIRTSEKNW